MQVKYLRIQVYCLDVQQCLAGGRLEVRLHAVVKIQLLIIVVQPEWPHFRLARKPQNSSHFHLVDKGLNLLQARWMLSV